MFTNTSRRDLIKGLALAGASSVFPACQSMTASRGQPNILLIMSDDAGFADFGFQNGYKDIPTPALDALRKEGMRFTQGYVAASVCSPSRAGMLIGRNPSRVGHECNLHGYPGLPLTSKTIANVMKEQGYATGILGKWHLGGDKKADAAHLPFNRGFDEFYGFPGGGSNYMPWYLRPGQPGEKECAKVKGVADDASQPQSDAAKTLLPLSSRTSH